MKTLNLNSALLFGVLLIGIYIASYLGAFKALPAEGSVNQGSDYAATSTRSAFSGTPNAATALIKGGYGSIGSFVVTGVAAGQVTFYDATTSDATKRSALQASSTIQIADFPASVGTGTYVLDVAFGRGLLVVINGTAPTSTVTYR